LQNGELLRTAEDGGMDVFVTGDTTLRYEQNLTGRHLAIVVLSVNNWPILKDHAGKSLAAIEVARPGSFVVVDCGKFSR
jgi:hypothetical protein